MIYGIFHQVHKKLIDKVDFFAKLNLTACFSLWLGIT
jgi:hypothetical protein